MPPHGHGHHPHGTGHHFSRQPGAFYYGQGYGPGIWDAPYPICYNTTTDAAGKKIVTQVPCTVSIPGFSGAGGTLGDGVSDLWTALYNLSAKIPQANPGPAASGIVTQQMLNALGAVAGSIPGLPSDVAAALRILPYAAALAPADYQAQIADVIDAQASNIARVVNAYAVVASSGGAGVGPIFPSSTITTYQGGVWLIAVPKAMAANFKGLGIIGPASAMAIAAGSYTQVGTAPGAPPGAQQLSNQDYKNAVTAPFYKAWWFWVPVGVVAAGTGGYLYLRKRKKRRK